MERPPSIVKVEDEYSKEKEISPEKKSRMWETLRIAALSGLLTFGSYEAVQHYTEDQDIEKSKASTEQTLEQEQQRNQDMNKKLQKEKQALTIKHIDGGDDIVDGKKVINADIIMEDGKEYKTRVESDIPAGVEGIKENTVGGTAWNKALVSSIEQDGSGVKVNLVATSEGLIMTVQELGPGGIVANERVSIIQEVNK